VLDFWRWSASDLLSNTARGVFAEFIVASALGCPLEGVREGWAAFDLLSLEGIKVEVKSSAYLQSWAQRRHSTIVFSTRSARAWDADTNVLAKEAQRQADVYVFALLAHRNKASVEPLDLDQWSFYVLSTAVLNARSRSQHSITLNTLSRMSAGPHGYDALRGAVLVAAQPAKAMLKDKRR
jgi:hypothetical protein